MEQIKIENLSFSYPLSNEKALKNISLEINSGEFVLFCGKSGCGKTTLLRQLKKELSPNGEKTGKIYIDKKSIDDLSLPESVEKVGFVMQNPDSQIVTDKVWHELSFGLENLGFDSEEIRLRTAEIAAYFGIEEWFNKKTNELSGGQKQILNLASVLVMHPNVLILDEPTSQIDPIAAEHFLYSVKKINRELGVTVILTEQRLEEAFTYADRVIVIDEGKIVLDASPEKIGNNLKNLPDFMNLSVPTAIRLFSECGGKGTCPITVRDGREWLNSVKHKKKYVHEEKLFSKKNAIELKDICFRYEKYGNDVLKNLSLAIPENTVTAILGSNGSGKTTLFRIIASSLNAYCGKVKICGEKAKKSNKKIVSMPQAVQALFTEKTVLLDLEKVQPDKEKISEISELTKIKHLLVKHPFDLSGGEQQRVALAKVLLCEPDILLLDEPTNGMDAQFKVDFASIISSQKDKGCTVIMISHDVEFCAKYADLCGMLFDGEIAAFAPSREFFHKNRFYTTAAARIARGFIEKAITDEEIILCVKEN